MSNDNSIDIIVSQGQSTADRGDKVDFRKEHMKKQAALAQKGDKNKKFPSEEARILDQLYKEVGIQSNHLAMTLVQTREKLKPFVDDGVVHKDRKRETKKATDDFVN